MIREWSCEAPRSCPSSNRSKPRAPEPTRFAPRYTALLPMPPRPMTATSNSRRSPIRPRLPAGGPRVPLSGLGLGVAVILVGGHGLAALRPPLPLVFGELAEGPGHAPDVLCDRAAARPDHVDAGVVRPASERRHLAPGELERGERVREVGRRGEVGPIGRGSVGDGLADHVTGDGLAHLERDRKLLVRAVQAVDADDVGAGVGQLASAVAGRVALVGPWFRLL